MKYKCIIISIILILLSSCSFVNNNNSNKSSTIEHPDLKLTNAKYKVNLSKETQIKFISDNIEFYNKKNLSYINNVSFSVTNNKNEIIAEGSSDKIEVNTKTNNLFLSKNVIIKIKNPQLNIKCDKINWNNKNRTLNTDNEVFIESEYGIFEGVGFSANLDTRYFEFKELKKGELFEKNN